MFLEGEDGRNVFILASYKEKSLEAFRNFSLGNFSLL
jgi:hypothetical protein